ncbi:urease accessory protein ureF [Candidatus Blochmanniella vafra str. BVAF]|uniref:Urease accessory protein UreF n=1 Tax=Blochmanniella vafra (strain BVAF) TaxID=859654 RepID=E8Q6D6_BLOVB|nr:urease accessory UreF family protein [Candidatus Blochmannia vafer]ADV33905.1 urease accessory protein ureF [Candidatus Blochmannia vafer str. BVAF]
MNTYKSDGSLLSLMQLVSSNLPVGSFSYSKGLESAIEFGWIKSIENFLDWQKQWIYGELMYLDWPMLKRCYNCAEINDAVKFEQCAVQVLSYRDTYELRVEEQQRGKAMSKLILQWYSPVDENWISGFQYSGLASVAWLGHAWDIPIKNLALGYAYNILESSVIIGLKLLPFGQNIAQQLIRYLSSFFSQVWDRSKSVSDFELGSNFLCKSIASSCHEIQYSRLFRS